MMQFKEYVQVKSLEEAYELNQKKNNYIIGGMHWLKMSKASGNVAIDLSGLGLDQIVETDDAFEIGCMTSLRALETHPGLNAYTQNAMNDALKDIVGVQFRNTATIGGSIFGRYGFSDVLSILLGMDSYVECFKAGTIPLCTYASMPYDRDIIVKIIIKKEANLKIAYNCLRKTRTDFPVVNCSVSNTNGKWRAFIGARPGRSVEVIDDNNLLATIDEASAEAFGKYVANNVVFGSNMRGSKEYRQAITVPLVKRALLKLGKE